MKYKKMIPFSEFNNIKWYCGERDKANALASYLLTPSLWAGSVHPAHICASCPHEDGLRSNYFVGAAAHPGGVPGNQH